MSIDVAAGGGYDKVVVQGSAMISGVLRIINYDNYHPQLGTTLSFLTASGVTGDFSSKTYNSECWPDSTYENTLFWSLQKN